MFPAAAAAISTPGLNKYRCRFSPSPVWTNTPPEPVLYFLHKLRRTEWPAALGGFTQALRNGRFIHSQLQSLPPPASIIPFAPRSLL